MARNVHNPLASDSRRVPNPARKSPRRECERMKREIEFASHPANLSLVREFVRQFLKESDFSETEKDLMVLGLDEACTNVIRYAYHHEQHQLMCLIWEVLESGVCCRLR